LRGLAVHYEVFAKVAITTSAVGEYRKAWRLDRQGGRTTAGCGGLGAVRHGCRCY